MARFRLVESNTVSLVSSELFSVAQLRIPIPFVFWKREAGVLIHIQEVAQGTTGKLPAIAFDALSAVLIAAARIACFLNWPSPVIAIGCAIICRVKIAHFESPTFPPHVTFRLAVAFFFKVLSLRVIVFHATRSVSAPILAFPSERK